MNKAISLLEQHEPTHTLLDVYLLSYMCSTKEKGSNKPQGSHVSTPIYNDDNLLLSPSWHTAHSVQYCI